MLQFTDGGPSPFLPDPRCIGASTVAARSKTISQLDSQLETACRNDAHHQDVPKVSRLRGLRFLGCFGCKPSADTLDGWEHMPHDILVAIVKAAGPADAKAMHMACRSWHMAVRCGLDELTPCPKHCDLDGIRCFFPRVTKLHLHDFGMREADAVQLGQLSRLRALQLDGVSFEGRTLISKLSTLQGLRQLDMMNVVGTYPAETEKFLASLTGLTCLRLRNDSLASKMPPMHCLSHLRGLQELALVENLHHLLPGLTNISALADLHQLSLVKVGVTNAVLCAVGLLTQLRSLHIPDAFRVTDAGLMHLSSLTGLTHLDFCSLSRRRDEDITNVGIAPLAGMTNLCSLNLAGHPEITAEALAFLADCTSLSRLDLSGMSLGPTGGCEFLAHLLQLQALSLQRTHREPEHIPPLASLNALTSLNLAWCGADDVAAAALAPLTKLRHLDLRFNPVTNAGASLVQLSRAMPDLARLDITGCPITCLGVWRLLSSHRKIKLWSPDQDGMNRFMNVADALLLVTLAPGQRRLRVAAFPEATWPLTALVSAGVALFFIAYLAVLLLFFTALFMFPIFMLGCIFVALCLAGLGARYTLRSIRAVWGRCDCAFSTFLLGQPAHANQPPQNAHHPEPHDHIV